MKKMLKLKQFLSFTGFCDMDDAALQALMDKEGLAMTLADLKHVQN